MSFCMTACGLSKYWIELTKKLIFSVIMKEKEVFVGLSFTPGCLQRYTDTEGSIESFNYKGFNRNSGLQAVANQGGMMNPYDQTGSNLSGPGGFPTYPNKSPLGPMNQQVLIQVAQPKYMNGLRYGICIAQQPMV